MSTKEMFNDYLAKYPDNKYSWKKEHSFRVAKLIKKIASSEQLNPYDIKLLTIAGLYHDIGRFPQINKYNSMNDIKTIDHGDVAYELIMKNNMLVATGLSESEQKVIAEIIKYHNKYKVPTDIPNYLQHYCAILRDADKIDILRAMVEGKIKFINDKSFISDSVFTSLLKEELVKRCDVETPNDQIANCFSFAYDINTKSAKKMIIADDLFNQFYLCLPNKAMFKPIKDNVCEYMERDERNVIHKI